MSMSPVRSDWYLEYKEKEDGVWLRSSVPVVLDTNEPERRLEVLRALGTTGERKHGRYRFMHVLGIQSETIDDNGELRVEYGHTHPTSWEESAQDAQELMSGDSWTAEEQEQIQRARAADAFAKMRKIETRESVAGLKDTGTRTEFETGAVREASLVDKGRYDLVSPYAIRRLAVVCAKGAVKYDDRNWEKGMQLHRYIDSAKRHLDQYLMGQTDEDHLGHALWNIHALIHTEEMISRGILPTTLDDIPKYEQDKNDSSRVQEAQAEETR